MNQQAGVFFIPIQAQPTTEAECVELAAKEVERIFNTMPDSAEREALWTVYTELGRRMQAARANARAQEAVKEKMGRLQGQLDELRETLRKLQTKIAA